MPDGESGRMGDRSGGWAVGRPVGQISVRNICGIFNLLYGNRDCNGQTQKHLTAAISVLLSAIGHPRSTCNRMLIEFMPKHLFPFCFFLVLPLTGHAHLARGYENQAEWVEMKVEVEVVGGRYLWSQRYRRSDTRTNRTDFETRMMAEYQNNLLALILGMCGKPKNFVDS